MSTEALYVAFLVVLLVPLLLASWRTSLAGLALQGVLLAWIAMRGDAFRSVHGWLTLADAGIVRAIVVPLLLYRVMRRLGASPRHDVIPPNMIGWTAAGVLVALAFRFAGRLAPDAAEQTAVAVVAAGVLLGLFVLSTQTSPFSQAIGALRVENAIALFEITGGEHETPLAIHAGLSAVFLLTAALFSIYVGWLSAPPPAFPPMRRPPL